MAVVKGDTFVQEVRIDDLSSQALQKIASAGKGLQATFGKLGAGIVVFNQAWELTSRVVLRLNTALKSVVVGAIDFEKAMAEVMTLVGNSASVHARLTDEVLALQSRYGTNQADIAKAYYQAISSGAVDATTASNLMGTAQKLAIGGVTDLSTAVDGLTTIINAYGLNASQALNVSDALFIGMKAGKTTIGELSMSLGQAASFASSMGVTFEELVSGVSALTTGGIQTTTAVTQLRAALVALSKPTEEMKDILHKLNITSIQAAIKQNGLAKTLQMIKGQTDGSSEALSRLFGRVEAINAVTALTSSSIGGKFNVIMGEMKDAVNDAGAATDNAFKIIENTTSQRLERAYGKIASFKTRTGLAFKDLYADTVDVFVESIKSIDALSKALKNINWKVFADGAQDAARSLAILGTALVALNMQKTIVVFQTLSTAIIAFARSIAVASAPIILLSAKIVLIAAGVTTAAVAIDVFVRNLDRIPDIIFAAILAIESFVVKVILSISRLILGLVLQVEKAANALNGFGILPDKNLAAFRTFIVGMSDSIDKLEAPIEVFDDKINQLTKNMDMGFGAKIFDEAKKFLKQFNTELSKTDAMSAAVADNLGDIKPVMEPQQAAAAQSQVALFSGEDINLIKGTFGDAAASIASSASSMTAVPLAFAQAANLILDAIQKLIDVIPNLINKMANIFKSVAQFPMKIADAFKNLSDSVMYLIENGEAMITNATHSMANLVWDLPENLMKAFENMLNNMVDMGEKWGETLVKVDPIMLVTRIITILIKNVPKIAVAFAKNLGPAIRAMGDAFSLTIKETINELAAALGLNKPFKIDVPDLDDEMGDLGNRISKSASDVFKVTDLEAATRGTDLADRIRNAIESSVNKAKNVFEKLWAKLRELWLWVWNEIILKLYDKLREAWLWVWNKVIIGAYDKIREAWLWVWNDVILAFPTLLKDAWLWVWEKVILPIATIVQDAFQWVYDEVILPIANVVKDAWQWVYDEIIMKIVNALGEFVGGIGTAIDGAIQGLVSFIGDIPTKISSAFTAALDFFKVFKITLPEIPTLKLPPFPTLTLPPFPTLTLPTFPALTVTVPKIPALTLPTMPTLKVATPTWLDKLTISKPSWLSTGGITIPGSSQLFGSISDAYKRSDAGKAITSVSKSVTSVAKRIKSPFATGGLATPEGKWLNGKLYAQGGAIAQGTDTIDARLTPGEFVVNREAARANIGLLSFINNSKAPVSPVQSPTNISIVINAKTDLSSDQIRREVIPTLEKELRAKSQQGRFMLATSGLRTNK